MTWTAAMIAVPMVCYLGAAVAYGLKGNWPLAVVYWHYAGANVGLFWLDRVMAK